MPTIAFPYKTKQFFIALLKLGVVLGVFYFIYHKLGNNNSFDFTEFTLFLSQKSFFSLHNLLILVVLSSFNWWFEIYKWQSLASTIEPISIKTSAVQTFGSLTVSLLTPNRIGEYGAKAIYFTPSIRKRIMGLNLIGNLSQMCITTILGTIGICFFVILYDLPLLTKSLKWPLLLVILVGCIIGVFWGLKKLATTKQSKTLQFLRELPKLVFLKTLGLSFLRYASFSFQWYVLLYLFGISLSFDEVMAVVSSIYLLASVIPSFAIFDVVIKGGAAVYLFGLLGVPEIHIITITTIMWLLNLAIPAIIGSYFVLIFKQPKTEYSL